MLNRLRAASHLARQAVVAAGAIAMLAVGLTVAYFAFTVAYDHFGFHPEKNARAWASRTPSYADSSGCAACHGGEYIQAGIGGHVGVACETCHGPLANHAASGAAVSGAGSLDPPELCVRCHEDITGRPAAFPQQAVSEHFAAWSCEKCHDPHSTIAIAPPPVSHPLDKLPDCLTCHGAGGMKPAPANHDFNTSDSCLSCHKQQPTTSR